MNVTRPSRSVVNGGVGALVLAVVAATGIAVGRWLVPAGEAASSASLVVADSSSATAFESVAPDASAGLMIGVRFQPAAPLGAAAIGVADAVEPGSPAEGHVIGVRFR